MHPNRKLRSFELVAHLARWSLSLYHHNSRLSSRKRDYGDPSIVARMQEYEPQYYLGQLEIQKDGNQVLRRASWKAIVTTAPELVEPRPRWIGNPASGKPMLLPPHMLPPDDRAARIGDKFIGSFRWSFYEYDPASHDDLGVVLIYAVPGQEEAIRSMAERFATTMNASFGVDSQLMQWNGKQN